jgi:hypothetical protein
MLRFFNKITKEGKLQKKLKTQELIASGQSTIPKQISNY